MFRQLPYALIPKLHSITMANQTLASQVKHILVVDDSHVPAQMVANVLRKAGHKVTIANDGQRAWLKAQQQQFDLVLTDEQMPCMNSSELCRRLRGLEGYKETPFILFTSKAWTTNMAHLMEKLDIAATVYKAFRPAELIKTVQAVLDREAITDQVSTDTSS
jgi:two-component system chemotaxis response regulator CheY